MTNNPILITDANLKDSWKQSVQRSLDNGKELTPFILSIKDFTEDWEFKMKLNSHLLNNGHQEVDTVATTIFPVHTYNFLGNDRHALYKEYMRSFPRIRAIVPKANGRGTYFQRLIAFANPNGEPINQLEIIIYSLTQGNVRRRSKLQASIFDATKDHLTGMFQGFPCMQHITFYKHGKDRLVLNAFYAMQYLYEKAYGNWLGLINLGKFIAEQSQLEFHQLNVYAGVEKLEVSRGIVQNLLED